MKQHSNLYIFSFAGLVCIVCSIFVAGSAVGLRSMQETNKTIDRQLKVLDVAGLLVPGESLDPAQVQERFDTNIRARAVNLETGAYDDGIDVSSFDQRKASKDLATRRAAPENAAKVAWLPAHALVYQVMDGDVVDKLILPVEGKGLWSTLYGFIALEADGNTVAGLTFYEHGETPGLGGEIDNPGWKSLWVGRKVYDETWTPKLTVIKGRARAAEVDPYSVDGISGATLTGRGVGNLVQFWMSDQGFGPYLKLYREGR